MPGLATTKSWVAQHLNELLRRTQRSAPHAAVYPRLAQLADRYRDTLSVRPSLSSYEARVFSQNGEDGVIAELLTRIGKGGGYFVEFGIGAGHEGNCVLLADVFGWSGLFIEGDPVSFSGLSKKYGPNPWVSVRHVMISVTNVESIFASAGVPDEPDVLSIDVDGNDYWVWEAIQRYRPRLVVIEYNASLGQERQLVQPLDESRGWDGMTASFGASLGALESLGIRKGYQLVHTDLTGINAFFVRADLAPQVGVKFPPRRSQNFCLIGGSFLPGEDRSWLDLGACPAQVAPEDP